PVLTESFLSLRKNALRTPFLNDTSCILKSSAPNATGINENQSKVFILLQEPVWQLPLLLQPLGFPESVAQLIQPIVQFNHSKFKKIKNSSCSCNNNAV